MNPTTDLPNPFDWSALIGALTESWDAHTERIINTWVPAQLAIIALSFIIATVIAGRLTPVLEQRLRRIEKQPRLMRVLVLPLRWLRWILFALFLWLAVGVLLDSTRLSRSTLVTLAASLVTAWVIIAISARLIRNRSIGKLFQYSAWIIAALYILGLLPQVLALLDQAAFTLGTFRLSLLVAIKALVLFTVLMWTASIAGDFVEHRIRAGSGLTPTAQVLLSKLVKTGLITLAFLVTLTATGIDLTVLALFSGALGLGIGFGLQKVASNLISGIIILLDKSIKPGDVISLGDTFGWITSLRARYVSVVTREGVEYLIPNESFVTDRVINWSYSNSSVRLEIKFGVSYESDPHLVRRVAVESIKKLQRVTAYQPPVCHISAFGDSAIEFVLRFWIADPQQGLTNIRGDAYLALWDALKSAGIKIPYPHREIIVRQGQERIVQEGA